MKRWVLSLCDYTGTMVEPWSEAGWEAICVDTQHMIRRDEERGGIRFVWGDVRSYWPETFEGCDAVFAFPPCTHLASSGSRDFEAKGLTLLIDALQLVESCRRICVASGAPWFIENPVGRLASIWRKPDYYFHPCDYTGFCLEDNYSKKTALWTGGGFVMPEPRMVEGEHPDDRIHKCAPSDDRENIRSATPKGFARAVFEANAPKVRRVA